jgi:transcription antitermination factor NusG
MDSESLFPRLGERKWFSVYNAPRHEKQVCNQNQKQSVECFLPLYDVVNQWKTGPARVSLPLFPNYLFVCIAAGERRKVLEVSSVVSIVGSGSRPLPVPDSEITQLRQSVAFGRVEPHPYLKVGSRVRVVRGPLLGVEGVLVRKKNVLKLVLSVEVIMHSLAIELSVYDVEPVQTDHTVDTLETYRTQSSITNVVSS